MDSRLFRRCRNVAKIMDRHLFMKATLKSYRAGITSTSLVEEMMALAEQGGFADYLIPGFEHDIGLLSDEWRIGFRYENPIVIGKDGCEERSKFPLGMKELK